jgi:S1-C subfamily serine protease
MTTLAEHSSAIADRVEAAAGAIAAVEADGRHGASAIHWRDGLFLTSEEAVEADALIRLTLPSGETAEGRQAGRDPSTGLVLVRSEAGTLPSLAARQTAARAGEFAIAVGRSHRSVLAGLGVVGEAGPAWKSMRGGAIDQRIGLAMTLGGGFEGGAALDAEGRLFGMILFDPRRNPIVIPVSTIERAAAVLAEKGHVERGYLGAGLHPVRQPGAAGAIVLSLDEEGPAKAAGIQLGDIITAWDGDAVHGPRDLIRRLSSDSVGRNVTLSLLRGGQAAAATVTIGAKPIA